jgi:hypothetical protein
MAEKNYCDRVIEILKHGLFNKRPVNSALSLQTFMDPWLTLQGFCRRAIF